MKTIPVSLANVALFIDYGQRFGSEHDESYLPDSSFSPMRLTRPICLNQMRA